MVHLVLWRNGWMDQDGTCCGGRPRRAGDIVLDGHQLSPKRGITPNFGPMSVVAKRLECWTYEDATWYKGRPAHATLC